MPFTYSTLSCPGVIVLSTETGKQCHSNASGISCAKSGPGIDCVLFGWNWWGMRAEGWGFGVNALVISAPLQTECFGERQQEGRRP